MAFLCLDINVPGDITIVVEWTPNNAAMNTSENPNKANFSLKIDGVPRNIEAMAWDDSPNLLIYAIGAAAVTSTEVFFNSYDANVQNTDGVKAIPPQSLLTLIVP